MRKPLRPVARRALAAQSDARLVRLIRARHEPAFEEAVRRYRGPLVAYAATIAGPARAEDVVQAGLERAHRALLADEREIALRSWLFAIVRNGALNSVRDEPTWSELDPEHDGVEQPPAIAERHEEIERVITAICALPDEQRRALVMRELDGAGHADIAARLHTSPSAVRGLIYRARTTVRDSLGLLIPVPLLIRLLEADAAGASAGAAGGGGALLGGAAGKGAAGVATAVIALGAGQAIHDHGADDEGARGGHDRSAQPAKAPGAGAGDATVGATTGAARDDDERDVDDDDDRTRDSDSDRDDADSEREGDGERDREDAGERERGERESERERGERESESESERGEREDRDDDIESQAAPTALAEAGEERDDEDGDGEERDQDD